MTDALTLQRIALDLAGRGWPVFPLRPGDKRPAFPDHPAAACTGRDPRCRTAGRHVGWEDRATTDPDRIRRGWQRAPLPGWLAKALTPQPVPPQQPTTVELTGGAITDRRGAYLRAALDRSAQAVRDSGDGQHNAALFGAACSLGELVAGGELTDQD